MKYTLDQRIERARALRADGYNCAQTVAMVFDDITPLGSDLLASATAALGGGIAGTHSVCGAVSAMAVVDGARNFHTPADKKTIYSSTATLIDRFKERNCGQTLCSELRQPGRKPCIDLIIDAIEIIHNAIDESA